ncbi:MAG: type I restriction endonuclease [Polyangiaceae bacterium]
MTANHTERAFEDAIEAHLVDHGGWQRGDAADFSPELALERKHVFAFIEATQPDLWAELKKQHGSSLEQTLLDWLTKALDQRGTLDVLRHGFKFYGKKIHLAYFKPAHSLNPDVLALYEENRLVVTRQVKFNPASEESIDMLLSLNGLPVATVELKNPLTHQTVEHAKRQYKKRDQKLKLFQFKKRALVHFAVDPDLVSMTTRLSGNQTSFLPFNRGDSGGAGNPQNPDGYRTAYLWEEVWQRDSFLDVVGRFIHLLTEEKWIDGKRTTKETMVFPRYHQLDVVRKLEAASRSDGAGASYLVQHSAGSGKSNSIAWLAHRLSELHDGEDKKVFDSVVVVTDRRVLDRQLQDTIYQFEHKQGVVEPIDSDSGQLAAALAKGTPIVITTLQKFPFVTGKIGELPNRRYAVIVDEAHSSQTGEAARGMKEVLAPKTLEEAEQTDPADEDYEDRILEVMASRGKQPNLSFFAFTATPKAKTLELFGTPDTEGMPRPFHLYSMRQAIEEGFILDVLRHYTTYKTFYRLAKQIDEDPEVPKRQAARSLARFMSLHPHNVAQKTEVMVEHFLQRVRHKIDGRAKAMVVTSSRLHAVRYKQSFDKYIREHGYQELLRALVAFSGTVRDPDSGLEFTEPGMNEGISEKQLRERFATDEFQVLLVANKYQTGFDQPLLHTMYVDKRLSGVQAVQTLSRLNRIHPGKTDTFVLDFVNDADEIERSFQPYYEGTTVSERADPQELYRLQHELDAAQIYLGSEVDGFCRYFYAPKHRQTVRDQAEMNHFLDPGVDRFKALDADPQDDFRGKLTAFVRLYAFLSQVMPFADQDLEKRYSFGRYLLTKLGPPQKSGVIDIDDDVALRYYRLQKVREGSIVLTVADGGVVKGLTDVGTRAATDEKAKLSEIIEVLNDRFGTDFTKADQLFFDQVIEEAKADGEMVQQAHANDLDNFSLAAKQKVQDLMIARLEDNEDIVTKYLNEVEFRNAAFGELVKRIYEEVRGKLGE